MSRRRRAVRRAARRPAPVRRRRLLPGLLVLLVLGLACVPVVRWALTPVEVRRAATALSDTSVTVAPGTQVLDVDRVRAVVGDRPLVVAVLAPTWSGRLLDACHAIARRQPRNLVLVHRSDEVGAYPGICAGDDFPEPDVPEPRTDALGDRTDVWLFGLSRDAQLSSQFRVAPTRVDRTPEVEELVLALDAQVARVYPDGLPRRIASPAPETLGRVLLQLAGLAGLLLAAFAGLRAAAQRVRRAVEARRALAERRAELDAGLSEVSTVLLHARPQRRAEAERQERVAELYLSALTALEAAHDEQGIEAAEQAVRQVRAAASAGTGAR